MSTLTNPTWQQPYDTAPIKFDPYKLVDRVRNAETPISSRMRELQASADERAERQPWPAREMPGCLCKTKISNALTASEETMMNVVPYGLALLKRR